MRKKGSQDARRKEREKERKRKLYPMTNLNEHHFQDNKKWLKEKILEEVKNL